MIGQVTKRLNSKGQIAVEYILLVVIAVAVASSMVSLLVNRSSDDPGIVIKAWQGIIEIIGNDASDEP